MRCCTAIAIMLEYLGTAMPMHDILLHHFRLLLRVSIRTWLHTHIFYVLLVLCSSRKRHVHDWHIRLSSSSCLEKKQLAENVQEQGGVCCDSLTTQEVNIHQLQDTLDTYFTINPYIWQYLISLVRLLFQTKCYSDLHY